MLQQKALYFARADRLGDPYEAYYTRAMADPAGFVEGVKASILSEGKEFGEKEEKIVKEAFCQMVEFMRNFRRCT